MSLQPATPEAMQLLMQGSIAFSRMEATGIRIDTAYLDTAIQGVKAKVVGLETRLRESEEYKAWSKQYGLSLNLESREQLGHVIFDILGHKRNPFLKDRETQRDPNNIAAFEHLKLPFISDYQDIRRLTKALATNLYGIKREVVDGRVHSFIDLFTTESYRSSNSRPNLQNQPIRNKDIARIARSCVIPGEGNVLLEPDFGTQEVRVSYCYNKDSKLRHDILNGDMHTDLTKELYLLNAQELGPVSEEPGKTTRYIGKNRFTFAEFYGSYYKQCAAALWDAISIYDLRRADGVSLFEHLRERGIDRLGMCDPDQDTEPGTFEEHVQKVERRMWKDRYTVYDRWKKDWWDLYLSQGGVNTLTGFRLAGYFKRNQILCDPIQGSAFHCLLWVIIRVQKELIRRKMKARIILQIHDSALADCPRSEISDFVEIWNRHALKLLQQAWTWITIPLAVEFDIAEENWFSKKPLEVEVAA